MKAAQVLLHVESVQATQRYHADRIAALEAELAPLRRLRDVVLKHKDTGDAWGEVLAALQECADPP